MLKGSLSRKTFPAWVMLGVGLLAAVFASLQVKQGIEQDELVRFAFACDQATLKIQERLGAYALILRGASGFLEGSSTVNRQDWRAYVETLRTEDNVPGMQGIGFAQAVPADQLDSHVARLRGEGFPGYAVRPSGERPFYTAIVYLEPFRGRNLHALGFDMFSEQVRRAAMERARDTGEAALSGKVKLLQETDVNVQAGILMYVPVYRKGMPRDTVEHRRAALIGWAYSPYRMNDLMGGILRDWELHEGKTICRHVYDGPQATPAAMLFENKAAVTPHAHSLLYQQRMIDFNGHQWLLVFDHAATASVVSYAEAWATLIGGLALSGLLFGLTLSVINTRANAVRIADELTEKIRRREDALAESELRYRTVADFTSDWEYWITPDGAFRYMSSSCEQITGYTRDEFYTDPQLMTRIVHPDDQHLYAGHTHRLSDQGVPEPLDYRIYTKGGECRWLSHVCRHINDATGQSLGLRASNRDITERKQMEQVLHDSETRFKNLVEATSDWIWEVDENAVYTYVSPRIQAILGYESAEILGKTPFDLMSSEEAKRVASLFGPLAAARQPIVSLENINIHKDGHTVVIETSGIPIMDLDGKFCGYRGIDRDITERKQMEDQVRQLAFHDQLTKLPNRRLLNDRLIQAMAASKRSGRYGAVMFLDLDNFKPLNDTYGHAVGDCLLVEVAERLKSCVREMDTVARFGGDEFVVILSELDVNKAESISQAELVAEKINIALSEPYLLIIKHEEAADAMVEYHCTASIGVALYSNHEGSLDDIFKWADTAMYQAKETGPNLIRFYDSEI